MLSASEINELKKRYGKVFAITVEGDECIFRCLTIGEFKRITSGNMARWQVADAEDTIVSTALAWPDTINTDHIPAGVISTLAEQILEASGFDDDIAGINAVLEGKREENESFQSMMMAFIIAAMPKYTLEDLELKTFDQLLSLLALSEAIFRIQKDLYNPNIAEIKLSVKTQDEEEVYVPEEDPIMRKLMEALPQKPAPSMKLPRGTRPDEVQLEYE